MKISKRKLEKKQPNRMQNKSRPVRSPIEPKKVAEKPAVTTTRPISSQTQRTTRRVTRRICQRKMRLRRMMKKVKPRQRLRTTRLKGSLSRRLITCRACIRSLWSSFTRLAKRTRSLEVQTIKQSVKRAIKRKWPSSLTATKIKKT